VAPADDTSGFLDALRATVGGDNLLTDPSDCWVYGQDNSRKHQTPLAVVFATSTEEVQAVVRTCHAHAIPITARGRGTGTAGAAIPAANGIVLSLERMSRILEIDPANRLMRVEPGALNQAVQDAAAPHGFFWPPDPTSAAFCTVGGNVAVNSAGPRAIKYGTTRDNVLGLTAVTGTGEIIHTGVNTTKGVVGYDLTRLIIGSEGTLAIVTGVTLKLSPIPETIRTLQATYRDIEHATRAVSAIMAQPVVPRALEFMDAAAIDMVRDYSSAALPREAGAMLMIEVDGSAAAMDAAVAAISDAAANKGLLSFSEARNASEAAALWATRKALSPALRNVAPNKINEDVVVPVSRIPALIGGLADISERFGIPIVNFGHAGNGNIHVNLLYDSLDPAQEAQARPCLDAVFDLVLRLRGTLSGEHGIGREKREYVAREIDATTLALMWGIKQQFDPRGILNPGKVFPAAFDDRHDEAPDPR
jgi:D-lactate dehydrogenase